jgi:hypothetical protein
MNVTLKKQFNDQIMLIKKNIKDKSAHHLFLSKCIDNYLKCEIEFSKKKPNTISCVQPTNFSITFTISSYITISALPS